MSQPPQPPAQDDDALPELLRALDEGELGACLEQPACEAPPLPRFSELQPFDLVAWAQRRGIGKA